MSIGPIIETQDDVDAGVAELIAIEPKFRVAVDAVNQIPLRRNADGFPALLSAICSQQISTAAAASVWARLEAANLTNPAAIQAATDEDIRACGMSRPKTRYARALADAGVDFIALRTASDEDVIKTLVAITGIGRWSAEIYAMFSLGRSDVFAPNDLALQEAAKILFKLNQRPSEKELRIMSTKWSPWRAIAARVLFAYYRVAKNREGIL